MNAGKLHVKEFSMKDKNKDWGLWVRKFEEAVNIGVNPHSRKRHHAHNLQWLPLCLDNAAYSMWERCPNKKKDWIKLKEELEQALEDPLIRIKWKTDPTTYRWEAGVDLQTYYTNVMKYVDKYDTEIASCPAAVSHQYYTRFLNGLPEEYKAQVHLSLPTNKEDIHKARDICQKKQSLEESSAVSMGTDVGAAAFNSLSNRF